jgi:putative PIN family toxin of toxin-antitoxin system
VSESVRAVVDSSVWVAAFLSRTGGSNRILAAFLEGRFEAVSSAPMLEELGQALNDDVLIEKYGLTWRDAEEFMRLLNRKVAMIAITGTAQGCRDPNDDKVIETALRGAAVVIVSGDQDLHEERIRELLTLAGVSVRTVGQFLQDLEE